MNDCPDRPGDRYRTEADAENHSRGEPDGRATMGVRVTTKEVP